MTVRYQGRLWDAPATDDAVLADLSGRDCSMCQEPVSPTDDAVQMGSLFHTECWLRVVMGDVAHLEGRCLCAGGSDHDDEGTYRESSQRALQWMVDHGRGRWADGHS